MTIKECKPGQMVTYFSFPHGARVGSHAAKKYLAKIIKASKSRVRIELENGKQILVIPENLEVAK